MALCRPRPLPDGARAGRHDAAFFLSLSHAMALFFWSCALCQKKRLFFDPKSNAAYCVSVFFARR